MRVAFDSFDRIGGIGFRPPAPAVAHATAMSRPRRFATRPCSRLEAGRFRALSTGRTARSGRARPRPGRTTATNRWDRTAVSRSGGGPGEPRDAVLRYDKRTRTHGQRWLVSSTSLSRRIIDDARPPQEDETRACGAIACSCSATAKEAGAADCGRRSIDCRPHRAGRRGQAARAGHRIRRGTALLDGKISPEEQTAIDAMTRLVTDVRALKPSIPDRDNFVQRTCVVLADLRLRSAASGDRLAPFAAGRARLPVTMEDLTWNARGSRATSEVVSGAEPFVHR